jgi:hypothetical protein
MYSAKILCRRYGISRAGLACLRRLIINCGAIHGRNLLRPWKTTKQISGGIAVIGPNRFRPGVPKIVKIGHCAYRLSGGDETSQRELEAVARLYGTPW